MPAANVEFSTEDDVTVIERADLASFKDAVLWGTDWTVETVLNQISRENIEINPQFQRRDAWTRQTKSRFIESVILGLPIPQIVLAERTDYRGKYIILDGKQRLLSLMQFAGLASDSKNNNFGLSGLEARPDLIRKRYRDLMANTQHQNDVNAFQTHTIRAVVIRNWPSMSFLHVVFQRLNTGSLKLSAQELRQALAPGAFTTFADDFAVQAGPIHGLLGVSGPDSRMRDTELLVRYVSFQLFLNSYAGRMKEFMDNSCLTLNKEWATSSERVEQVAHGFLDTIMALEMVLGEKLARKAYSNLFNRSIFDTLAFFASDEVVRSRMIEQKVEVMRAYEEILLDDRFQEAVESDTAGIPHTISRLQIWGSALSAALEMPLQIPRLEQNAAGLNRIVL